MGRDARARLVGCVCCDHLNARLADARSETDMQNHDTDYCTFREIKTVVVTWNAGASTPTSLRYDENDLSSFRELLHVESPPEILVFGFQELVDLDDKKLTASSFPISP